MPYKDAYAAGFGFLVRHTSTQLSPDPLVAAQLRAFVKQDVLKRISRIKDFNLLSFPDFIESIELSKRPIYEAGYEKFLATGKITTAFELMQKGHETNIRHEDDVKPRGLFNPHATVKAVLGIVNQWLLHFAKQMYPELVLGLNCSQLEERFNTLYHLFADPSYVSFDGASFDAHQNPMLIRAVDLEIYKALWPLLLPGLVEMELSLPLINEVWRALTIMDITFIMYYPATQSRRIMLKGVLSGTTYTGSPTRTTFGNSLR